MSSKPKRGLPLQVKMRHDTHFVEELANRHETPVGKMVPISSLEPNPHQPRTALGSLEELVASIQEKGVLEPILVRRRDAGPQSRYQIISGERRFRAAQEAGLYELPVVEMEVSDEEALEIALVENLQRKDLSPLEEAEGFRSLAEGYGYTHEQIAAAVGKSRSVVTETLSLLNLPPRVREAVEALGLTAKSALLQVLKAASEEEMLALVEQVSRHGLSRDDLRRRLKSRKKTAGRRPKPYVFKFKAPDKRYSLSLSFRQTTVDKEDLIHALEEILDQLRREN